MEYPNWFAQSAQYNFDVLLQRFIGEDYLRFMQLGAYTGDASLWMLENINDIELTDIDTWQGSNELAHESINFDEVYEIYLEKISKYRKQVHVQRCTTTDYLLAQYGSDRPLGEHFDFIYVDADHTTVGVLVDAELSWPLLKSGGVMAFDDYTWHHHTMDPRLEPKVGIDLFLHRHTGKYEILAVNDQVWIEKH
jgi:predicted O-methyltransferase YrrM